MPALDSLRVVALDRLVLHEAHDEARLRRVLGAMDEEGFQRNPVIVAPLPGEPDSSGRYFVLDGAHRSHALRGLGSPLALVQVVGLPERADGWAHLIPNPDGLEERLRSLDGVEVGPVSTGNWWPSGDRDFIAEVALSGGRIALRVREEGVASMVRALWSLRKAYPEGGRYRRVRPGEPVRDGEAVVSYRRFTPAELVAVVERGRVLPAGVTRFVVGERVLNVRLPLAALREGDEGAAEAELRALVRAAREADRVRYYGEPVVLFE